MGKKIVPPPSPAAPGLSRSPSVELVYVPSTAHLPDVMLFEHTASSASPSRTPEPAQALGPPQAPPHKRQKGVSRRAPRLDPDTTMQGFRRKATYADMEEHFLKTIDEAAVALGMSVTLLKDSCRAEGIKRWPARRLHAINLLLRNTPRVTLQSDFDTLGLEKMAIHYYGRRGSNFKATPGALIYFKKQLHDSGIHLSDT